MARVSSEANRDLNGPAGFAPGELPRGATRPVVRWPGLVFAISKVSVSEANIFGEMAENHQFRQLSLLAAAARIAGLPPWQSARQPAPFVPLFAVPL